MGGELRDVQVSRVRWDQEEQEHEVGRIEAVLSSFDTTTPAGVGLGIGLEAFGPAVIVGLSSSTLLLSS